MGSFGAAKWLVGMVLYYFIFFIVVVSIVSGKTQVSGIQDNGVSWTSTGFAQAQHVFSGDFNGLCRGTGKMSRITRLISCHGLVPSEDYNCDTIDCKTECESVSNCTWKNTTSIFGFAISSSTCHSFVNQTFYNITGSRTTFCENSTGLINNQGLCETLGCTWVNQTVLAEELVSGQDVSFTNVWQTVKDVTFFRVNLGIPRAMNFIFIFIFVYLPALLVLLAVFFAVPFLHS